MAKQPALDEFGLRRREHWPKFSDDEQRKIIGFLAFLRDEAAAAFERSSAIAAIAQEDLGSADNARYWAYAVRSIDWIISRVSARQKALEVLQAIQDGRYREPTCAPDTSSAPVASPAPLESGGPRARPPEAGTLYDATSAVSSRKRKPTRSKRS